MRGCFALLVSVLLLTGCVEGGTSDGLRGRAEPQGGLVGQAEPLPELIPIEPTRTGLFGHAAPTRP